MRISSWWMVLSLLSIGCGARAVDPADEVPAVAPASGAAASASIEISGLVKKPVSFSLDDLRRLDAVSARAVEVRRGGEFFGSYTVRGVPLRTLLDAAGIEKGRTAFDKPLDLAIAVTGADGRRAIVSWGELYYRDPSEVIVAYESQPVIPHKPCERCHGPEVFGARLEMTKRALGFPKLVATGDLYGDRFVEGIARIEVIEPSRGDPDARPPKRAEGEKLWAEALTIAAPGAPESTVASLDGCTRLEVEAIMAGDGIGYHGTRRFSGVALSELLVRAGVKPDPAAAILMTAPDGYRVLLSSAEVFDAPAGAVILADAEGGSALEDGGRFHLVLPGDHAADRWLKSVARVEVVKP